MIPVVGINMKPWQRIFLRGAGAGAGAILATGLVLLALVWYSGRPKHPVPWNARAISARYDKMDTGLALDDQGGRKQELRVLLRRYECDEF
jgi:hypothetical protein